MKIKTVFILIIISAVLVFLTSILFDNYFADRSMPRGLIGNWSSRQTITVRSEDKDGKFSYVDATVNFNLYIDKNADLVGSCGGADMYECKIALNRGWFGRLINVNTDYIITGKLDGQIFKADPLPDKEISFPFNLNGDVVEGTLFQKRVNDDFPMVKLRLSRK